MEIKIKGLKETVIVKVSVPFYNNEVNLRVDGYVEDIPCQIEFNGISVIHAKRMISQLNAYIAGLEE